MSETFADRLKQIQERVSIAAARSGRDAAAVQIVAVTKTHGPDTIEMAYHAGMRHFGENRVEEAEEKLPGLQERLPDAIWHMIGHLQSRKTDRAAEQFSWIHSIDRYKIARRLSEAVSTGRLDILLEVNISGEASKYGFDLAGWPDAAGKYQQFIQQVEQILTLPGINVRGLMTLAPYTTDPEMVRPIFRHLNQVRERLQEHFPGQNWSQLSMGMSADFEVAIEEGATMVRLGTALFGAREY